MIDDTRLSEIKESTDIRPFIKELLEGIQDLNWPNAKEIVEILRPQSIEIIEYVKEILRSNDSMWICWVLQELVDYWPKNIVVNIEVELIELSERIDKYESIDVIAAYFLKKSNLGSKDRLKNVTLSKIEKLEKEINQFSKHEVDKLLELEGKRIDFIMNKPDLLMDFINKYSVEINSINTYLTLVNYHKSLLELGVELEG